MTSPLAITALLEHGAYDGAERQDHFSELSVLAAMQIIEGFIGWARLRGDVANPATLLPCERRWVLRRFREGVALSPVEVLAWNKAKRHACFQLLEAALVELEMYACRVTLTSTAMDGCDSGGMGRVLLRWISETRSLQSNHCTGVDKDLQERLFVGYRFR